MFIIVNAQINKSKEFKYLNVIPRPPSTKKTLMAAMATLMNSSNFDTLYMFKKYIEEVLLKKQMAGEDTSKLEYDLIHISFEEIADDEEDRKSVV